MDEQRNGFRKHFLRWARVALYLYFFLLAIAVMGAGFKGFKAFAAELLATASHPLTGLFIGVLATSIVQSSSSITAIVVSLCAAGVLPTENAIPIVMGANIGTSVTNMLVSLAYFRIRAEFRKAVSAATVHDFFNILTVAILFPLNTATGFLHTAASYCADRFFAVGRISFLSPIKAVTHPVVDAMKSGLEVWGLGGTAASVFMIIFGLAMLFTVLVLLTKTLRSFMMDRAAVLIDRVLSRSGYLGLLVGAGITAVIQSSSVTTSLLVPLAASGIVTLEQIYPITLGANIGTTVTALLASFAAAHPAAITVAFAHMFFNILGTSLFYPVRRLRMIPIRIAGWMGEVCARRRWIIFAYVACALYAVPAVGILLGRLLGG